ncbi:unnamed protein product [Alternaria alternata]
MRFLGQSKQIISHVPLVAAPQTCSRINDAMHAAVIMNSEKFSVLSMLPLEGKEAARELASSVFDRHPGLRLILAHPGVLPSLIPRIEMLLTTIPAADKPKRSFLDVWQHNIYLTTADAQDMSSLRALLEQIPVDRVLYASNYPFEERGKELMDELRDSGFLTQVEWERVAWGNAEIVFGLKGANTKGGRR